MTQITELTLDPIIEGYIQSIHDNSVAQLELLEHMAAQQQQQYECMIVMLALLGACLGSLIFRHLRK